MPDAPSDLSASVVSIAKGAGMAWHLTEARSRFNELLTRALTEGPQRVHYRGQVVVVLSEAEYQRLAGQPMTLKDAILNGPDLSGLDLRRDTGPMRPIDG